MTLTHTTPSMAARTTDFLEPACLRRATMCPVVQGTWAGGVVVSSRTAQAHWARSVSSIKPIEKTAYKRPTVKVTEGSWQHSKDSTSQPTTPAPPKPTFSHFLPTTKEKRTKMSKKFKNQHSTPMHILPPHTPGRQLDATEMGAIDAP